MKRGESGLNLVVGIDKPCGMTSHDVVGACRRIFGEKRVGHAGTLDPLATGVLVVLVGSAARLNRYLTGHDKAYEARIAFGASTDTDDARGTVLRERPVPTEVADAGFAVSVLERFTGDQMQMPPVYSALKRNGKKACDEARKGNVIQLEPRSVTVHAADLLGVESVSGTVFWDVRFSVSKGTYIRSLARDMGRACGTEAHLAALRRVGSGAVGIAECVSLETLAEVGVRAALDPVRALGFPLCFADADQALRLANGAGIPLTDATFHAYSEGMRDACACTSGLLGCARPDDGALVSMACGDRLLAICRLDAHAGMLRPEAVFKDGVSRGRGL